MHSVHNLLKFNHGSLEIKIDYETMSLDELKRNYSKYRSLTKDKKMLDSLSDKGEKLLHQLKHIEDVIKKRCHALAAEFGQSDDDDDLMKLLDKYSELVKTRVDSAVKKEAKSSPSKPVKEEETKAVALETPAAVVAKPEPLEQEYQQILSKIQDANLRDDMAKDLKSEDNQAKLEKADKLTKLVKIDPSKNYFAKSVTAAATKTRAAKEKKLDVNKLNEIKEKIKQKSLAETKQAKELTIEESYRILKEHEKKVQDIQIQQTAQKLLQGQSVVYDYSFLSSTSKENLRYRENKPRRPTNGYGMALHEDDDEDEDEYEENDGDLDDQGDALSTEDRAQAYQLASLTGSAGMTTSSIDRLHKSEKDKHKFKNEDLESLD